MKKTSLFVLLSLFITASTAYSAEITCIEGSRTVNVINDQATGVFNRSVVYDQCLISTEMNILVDGTIDQQANYSPSGLTTLTVKGATNTSLFITKPIKEGGLGIQVKDTKTIDGAYNLIENTFGGRITSDSSKEIEGGGMVAGSLADLFALNSVIEKEAKSMLDVLATDFKNMKSKEKTPEPRKNLRIIPKPVRK